MSETGNSDHDAEAALSCSRPANAISDEVFPTLHQKPQYLQDFANDLEQRIEKQLESWCRQCEEHSIKQTQIITKLIEDLSARGSNLHRERMSDMTYGPAASYGGRVLGSAIMTSGWTEPPESLASASVLRRSTDQSEMPLGNAGSRLSKESDEGEELLKLRSDYASFVHKKSKAKIGFNPTLSKDMRKASESFTSLVEPAGGCCSPFIGKPTSRIRIAWDCLAMLLILMDLVFVPLKLAFQVKETPLVMALTWSTLVFWTLNVFASLTHGFFKHGIIVMDPVKIAKRYLKTWFFLDVITLVPDWSITVYIAATNSDSTSASSAAMGSTVKLLRVLRLGRLLRLLRLLKLRELMRSLEELFDTEYFSVLTNIIKMTVAMLILTHYVACGWYLVGSAGFDEKRNWIADYGFRDDDSYHKYIACAHWAISQYQGDSGGINAVNAAERTYSFIAIALCVLAMAGLVANITGSMMKLQHMSAHAHKQFWAVRRFLKAHKVSAELSARITKYLEHAYQQAAGSASMDKIPLLEMLTEQLRGELMCDLWIPHLSVHPLFAHMVECSRTTVHRLTNGAISVAKVAGQDIVFEETLQATHMYICSVGIMQYCQKEGERQNFTQVKNEQDWLAEMVLWTPSWSHKGRLVAMTSGEVVKVDGMKFIESMALSPEMLALTCLYAENFVQWFNEGLVSQAIRVSDLWEGSQENLRMTASFIPSKSAIDDTMAKRKKEQRSREGRKRGGSCDSSVSDVTHRMSSSSSNRISSNGLQSLSNATAVPSPSLEQTSL